MPYIILIAIIIGLIIYIAINKKKGTTQDIEETEIKNNKNDELPYIRKYLLTKNEYYFYKKLKPIANGLGYTVLAKIRMADLVDIKHGLDNKTRMSYFGKIKSKHVDFALAKADNLFIELLIELDDSSHKKDTRAKRDDFINRVYGISGYKILHVHNEEQELKQKIEDAILKNK